MKLIVSLILLAGMCSASSVSICGYQYDPPVSGVGTTSVTITSVSDPMQVGSCYSSVQVDLLTTGQERAGFLQLIMRWDLEGNGGNASVGALVNDTTVMHGGFGYATVTLPFMLGTYFSLQAVSSGSMLPPNGFSQQYGAAIITVTAQAYEMLPCGNWSCRADVILTDGSQPVLSSFAAPVLIQNPEPETLLLMGAGLAGLWGVRKYKISRRSPSHRSDTAAPCDAPRPSTTERQ